MQRLTMRFALAACAGLLCTATHALDLTGSYQSALQTDPSQLAANRALEAGREKAVQGRSLLLPQIGLTASAMRLNARSSSDVPPQFASLVDSSGSGTVREAAVQLVQPLYDQRAVAEKHQLQEQAAMAEIQHRAASQDLVQRVAESYFGLLLAQEQVRVVRAEKAAVTQQRDRAQARFEVGRGRSTDVQEAQARYDAVLAREVSATGTLAQREAQFAEVTGTRGQKLAVWKAAFKPVPPQPDDLGAWQQRGAASQPRVLLRQRELAIAGAEIDKYRWSGRPTLDLVASHGWKGQGGGGAPAISPDSSRSTALGLQFSMPLYNGGGIQSKLRESLAKREQAQHEVAAAEREMRLQVQDAFLATRTGVARIASLEQSMTSARTALEATTLGRDLGTRTELDVLDAQQRLFNTQLELAQVRTDYLLGRVRLAAAAGELQEASLRELDTFLEP